MDKITKDDLLKLAQAAWPADLSGDAPQALQKMAEAAAAPAKISALPNDKSQYEDDAAHAQAMCMKETAEQEQQK